tara:strand:- start:163 stop:663 length:501 start_codon:yes stop_codon:yes gene_type:complete
MNYELARLNALKRLAFAHAYRLGVVRDAIANDNDLSHYDENDFSVKKGDDEQKIKTKSVLEKRFKLANRIVQENLETDSVDLKKYRYESNMFPAISLEDDELRDYQASEKMRSKVFNFEFHLIEYKRDFEQSINALNAFEKQHSLNVSTSKSLFLTRRLFLHESNN